MNFETTSGCEMTGLITNLLRRRHQAEAVSCESCASVCDSACRSAAIRTRSRDTAAAVGPRF